METQILLAKLMVVMLLIFVAILILHSIQTMLIHYTLLWSHITYSWCPITGGIHAILDAKGRYTFMCKKNSKFLFHNYSDLLGLNVHWSD